MKARSIIEAESPKEAFKHFGERKFQPRKLTPNEIERLANIIAYGPVTRKPFDQRFFDWGYVETYDGMEGTVEAKAGLAKALYNDPVIKGGVGPEWWDVPPGAGRGQVRTYHWRESEDPKGAFKNLPRATGTTEVESSGGIFKMNADGDVLEWNPYSAGDADYSGYSAIARFDVAEWREHHKWTGLELPRGLDVLDLGFWTRDGVYEPPDHEWRRIRHECFNGHLANPESADGSVSKTVNLGGAIPPVPTTLAG